jgi:hypothetical protein
VLAEPRGFISAAALCALALLSAPACAQSLSLSYQLDPVAAPQLPKVGPLSRCSALTWVASIAPACIAESTAARLVSAVNALRAEMHPAGDGHETAVPRRVVAAGAYSGADVAPPRYELPTLGSPSGARVLRAAGGRDDSVGNARNVDLNFRFGSKNRVRGAGDEGVSDVASENRLPSNGVKNIGVELLFPFQ